MLSRLITRAPRRQFSKYIEDNYGKELHRLANRPGIEVKPTEVFVYACGAFLLAADVSLSYSVLFRLVNEFRLSVITKFIVGNMLQMEAPMLFGINAFGLNQMRTACAEWHRIFSKTILFLDQS